MVPVGCFIYYSRTKSIAGATALVGSLIVMVSEPVSLVWISTVGQDTFQNQMEIVTTVCIIGKPLFAVGFFGIALSAKRDNGQAAVGDQKGRT